MAQAKISADAARGYLRVFQRHLAVDLHPVTEQREALRLPAVEMSTVAMQPAADIRIIEDDRAGRAEWLSAGGPG
jgi:hypothetical protein